jgi:hypothetical protein
MPTLNGREYTGRYWPVTVGGGNKMSASKPPLETNGKIPQTYSFSLGMLTSMNALTVLFIGDVILLSVVTERALSRLRRFHPALFHALGKPAPEDSNLTYKYWAFTKFLWWDYRKVNDHALRRLCQVYCLGALAAIALVVIFGLEKIG